MYAIHTTIPWTPVICINSVPQPRSTLLHVESKTIVFRIEYPASSDTKLCSTSDMAVEISNHRPRQPLNYDVLVSEYLLQTAVKASSKLPYPNPKQGKEIGLGMAYSFLRLLSPAIVKFRSNAKRISLFSLTPDVVIPLTQLFYNVWIGCVRL